MTLEQKLEKLLSILREMESVLVAYSGGVDSTFLAKAAYEALGEKAIAVTARSPSYPEAEFKEAIELAKQIGIKHIIIDTEEVKNPEYAKNPTNRCFFCKDELFTKLEPLAKELGVKQIVYGAIVDDRGDFRPGQQAARQHGIRAPLDEADLTKDEIRVLSKRWGLPTWNKPSFACLSSRFPYGTQITPEKLKQVELAEQFLRDHGFRTFRVRHHEAAPITIARIELLEEDMERLLDPELRHKLNEHFKKLGYTFVTMDLSGFRSGSMNVMLQAQPALVNIIDEDD